MVVLFLVFKGIAIVVHIYNGILLSYKKEHIQVSPNEVDKPRPPLYKVK